MLDGGRPAFANERVAGDRAGITIVSHIVALADPLVLTSRGSAAEVSKLVGFVAQRTGMSQDQMLAALKQNFPHTTALLQAVPLQAVNDEIPKLVSFLAQALNMSPAQVNQTLASNVPGLTQAITSLPAVVNGWDNVPGTAHLTRFNGSAVGTVPQVRDYFSKDVIPVLEHQRTHFQTLDRIDPPVNFFAPLLVVIGILVIVFGGAMLWVVRRRTPESG